MLFLLSGMVFYFLVLSNYIAYCVPFYLPEMVFFFFFLFVCFGVVKLSNYEHGTHSIWQCSIDSLWFEFLKLCHDGFSVYSCISGKIVYASVRCTLLGI